MLTVQQVERALPATLKGAATQSFVDQINNIVSDPIIAEQIRDNFISYSTVLKDGKFKTEDYLNAVTYVSFKLMGLTNLDSYSRTFQNRYQLLLSKGTSSKDIAAYVSAYNKGKLVNLILEQTLVPTWVLNQHIHQKAINVQAALMMDAQSEFVRMQAANSILTHLGKPKEVGPLINLDLRESSGMDELKDLLTRLATQQQSLITNGVSTSNVAAQVLVVEEDNYVQIN